MEPGVQQGCLWITLAQAMQPVSQQVIASNQREAGQPLPTPLAELLIALLRVVRKDCHPGTHTPAGRGA